MRKVVAIILIILSATLLYRGYYNYNGYCFRESRYLADSEKYNIAMRRAFSGHPRKNTKLRITNGEYIRIESHKIYKNFDEFLKINSDCCKLTQYHRENYQPALSVKLIGNFSEFVRYEYEVDTSTPPLKHYGYVALTNCGNPWSGV